MADIEYWATTTAWFCPTCESLHPRFDAECVHECNAELVEVDVVRASQLWGAVEERDRLRDALDSCTLARRTALRERDEARDQLRGAVGALREAREYIAAYSPQDDAGFYDDAVQVVLDRLDAAIGGGKP